MSWNEAPNFQAGIGSKLMAFPGSVMGATRAIWRNKRRSMSMIAGLVLGISILAGIFIYSTVMMNNVYDSIIEGSPYEIRIDFKESDLTTAHIENYRQKFLSDPKILDVQLMYGEGRTVTETTGTGTSIYSLGSLEGDLDLGEARGGTVPSAIRIITEGFLEDGEIGQRLKEKIVSGEADLFTIDRGIFISKSFAEENKLLVGEWFDSLTLKISKYDSENSISERIVSQVEVENITIAGIFEADVSASAGLFSDIFSSDLMYIPDTIVNTTFLTDCKSNEMHYMILKIDENKFNTADPGAVNTEINTLINSYERENSELVGTNIVQEKLLPFQIMSIFIFIFDAILTLPVVILSLYLLSFGIDLSLEERRYQIGVLKTQGASPRQIKWKVLGETFILTLVGLLLGYIFALFGGWAIGTAKGFMVWDWGYAISMIDDFLILDQTALLYVGGFVSLFLIYMVNSKINRFIEMDIAETVREAGEEQDGTALKRGSMDLILFAIGVLALLMALMTEFADADFGFEGAIIQMIGSFCFWIGGASVTARLAMWVPSKLDGIIKTLFSDVAVLIKGNVFRTSSEIPRLALIIALTVSFAILANVQGQTGEVNTNRIVTWQVGSDLVITTGFGPTAIMVPQISSIDSSIKSVTAVSNTNGIVLNDQIQIHSMDTLAFDNVVAWQSDNFEPGVDRKILLNNLSTYKLSGCLMGKDLLRSTGYKVGEKVLIEYGTFYWNGSSLVFGHREVQTNIIGVFDHLPGGWGASGLVVDHALINSLYNLSGVTSVNLYGKTILTADIGTGILTDTYMVKLKEGVDHISVKEKVRMNASVNTVKSMREELTQINEMTNVDFGIEGLLTADFLVSLLAATLGTYIFMSILMEKRKKEFAIIRSYGGSNKQIYKIVFSETILLLLTCLIWGLLLGIGLAYLFNGFFEFMAIFITPASLLSSYQIKRLIIYDWVRIFITLALVFISMIIAIFISVRGAIKANISTTLRQI